MEVCGVARGAVGERKRFGGDPSVNLAVDSSPYAGEPLEGRENPPSPAVTPPLSGEALMERRHARRDRKMK